MNDAATSSPVASPPWSADATTTMGERASQRTHSSGTVEPAGRDYAQLLAFYLAGSRRYLAWPQLREYRPDDPIAARYFLPVEIDQHLIDLPGDASELASPSTAAGATKITVFVAPHLGAIHHRHDATYALPPELEHIRKSVENSRGILTLEPDEERGEAGYSEETWNRAVDFVTKNAKWLWDSLEYVIDVPQILPGPDGSIDIHWDHPSFEMLINIPADPSAKAGFYGDDRGEIVIKGSFDQSKFNHGLLLWLAKSS